MSGSTTRHSGRPCAGSALTARTPPCSVTPTPSMSSHASPRTAVRSPSSACIPKRTMRSTSSSATSPAATGASSYPSTSPSSTPSGHPTGPRSSSMRRTEHRTRRRSTRSISMPPTPHRSSCSTRRQAKDGVASSRSTPQTDRASCSSALKVVKRASAVLPARVVRRGHVPDAGGHRAGGARVAPAARAGPGARRMGDDVRRPDAPARQRSPSATRDPSMIEPLPRRAAEPEPSPVVR